MKLKNLPTQNWQQETYRFLHKTNYFLNRFALLLLLLLIGVSSNAQKTFIRQSSVNISESNNLPFPTVLETGEYSYFSILNGCFRDLDDISANANVASTYYNYLLRYDLDGNIEASRKVETEHFLIDMAYSKDVDNEYLYALETWDNDGGKAYSTVHKMKAGKTTLGDGIWSYAYVSNTFQNTSNNTPIPQSIIPYHEVNNSLTDEGCLVSTYLRDYALDDPYNPQTVADYLNIIRLDKNGNIVWKNFIGVSSQAVNRVRMIQNTNGVYILYNVSLGNGGTSVYLSKLDPSNGYLLGTQLLSTNNGTFLYMYDLTSNGSDVLICGNENNGGGTSRGIILKVDEGLNFQWSKSFNPGIVNNQQEIFFRILYNKDDQYFIGAYINPNSRNYRTISSLTLSDLGPTCQIVSHSSLTPTSITGGDLDMVDMELDLSCGTVYLCKSTSTDIYPSRTNLIRTAFHEFGCYMDPFVNFLYSNLTLNSVSMDYFHDEIGIANPSLTPLGNPEINHDTVCQTCISNPNPLSPTLVVTIQNNSASSNCAGNTMIVSGCYSYFQWYRDGVLVETSKSNEYLVTLGGIYTVRAYYSSTCYDISALIPMSSNPPADFSFSDNCEGIQSVFTNLSSGSPNFIYSEWTYGDGTNSTLYSSSAQSSNHTYANPGAYSVKLKMMRTNGCTYEITKTINIYSSPIVSFTQNSLNPPLALCLPSITTWTGSASVNLGQTVTYDWNFNDANQTGTITGQNQTFYFSALGNHTIVLNVSTNKGCSASKSVVYDVYVPTGVVTQDNYCKAQTVTLTANYTSPYGTISSYEWLENYNSAGTGNSFVAQYSNNTNIINLITTDNWGCVAEKIITISYTDDKPTVNFTTSVKTCSDEFIYFYGTASSLGTTITSWNWDFDDGNTASTQNASNKYPAYFITAYVYPKLTVIDGRGCINTYSTLLTLNPKPFPPSVSATPYYPYICPGQQTTLTHNGPSTFNVVWFSSDPSINNSTNLAPVYTSPSVNTTMTYSVKIINPITGCSNVSLSKTITTIPIYTAIFSSSTTNILCPGTNITLNGMVGTNVQTYEWEYSPDFPNTPFSPIINSNSQSWVVSTPGHYRFKANNVFGCVDYSNEIIILGAGNLSISNNLPIVDNLSPGIAATLFINTVNAPPYSLIQWFRNDIPIASGLASIPLTLPGDYYAIASGCGMEKSNIDVVNFENNSGSWDRTYLTGYSCSSGPCTLTSAPGTGYLINGDITLTGSSSMTITGTINFMGCRRITVNSGCTLTISNGSVISSATEWEGIYVASGGSLINNGCDISNAVMGIYSKNGGRVTTQNSTFGRNIVHIVFENYNLGSSTATVNNNTFGHVIDGPALTCTGYTEYNNLNIPRGNQIFIKGASTAQAISFNANTAWLTQKHAGIDNTWLSAIDNKNLSITLNVLKGFYNTTIKLENCSNSVITANQLTALNELDYVYTCPCGPRGSGFYFKNSENANISGNRMRFLEFGMEYYENLNNSPASNIYTNYFLDGKYGLAVAPFGNPRLGGTTGTTNRTQYGNQIDLNIYCNLFAGNEVGIIGSGGLIPQGGGTSAGNRFKDVTLLNTLHSILWDANSQRTYNFVSLGSDDDPDASNPSYSIDIDGTGITNSSSKINSTTSPGASPNLCTGGLKRSIKDPETSIDKTTIKDGPSIYPNPTSTDVNINGMKGNALIRIYDSNGKLIMQTETDSESITLSLENYVNGLYFINVTDENGNAVFKMLKISSI